MACSKDPDKMQAEIESYQLAIAELKRELMVKEDENASLHSIIRNDKSKFGSMLSKPQELLKLGKSKTKSTKVQLAEQMEEISEREGQLTMLKSQLRDFQAENAALKGRLATEKELASDNAVNVLLQEVQFLKLELEQAKHDVKQKEDEVARVTEEMVARIQKDMDQMNGLTDQVEKLKGAEEAAKLAKEEMIRLQSELSAYQRSNSSRNLTSLEGTDAGETNGDGEEEGEEEIVAFYKEEKARLQGLLDTKEGRISTLEASLAQKGAELSSMEFQLSVCKDEVQQVRDMKVEFEETISGLQRQLEAHTKEAEVQKRAEIESLQTKHQNEVTNLQTEMVALRHDLEAMKEAGGVLMKEKEMLTSERDFLAAQVKTLERAWIQETVLGCAMNACDIISEMEMRKNSMILMNLKSENQRLASSLADEQKTLDMKDQEIEELHARLNKGNEKDGKKLPGMGLVSGVAGGASKLGRGMAGGIGKTFKFGNKDKEGKNETEDLRVMVQDTLQTSMQLEEENRRLKARLNSLGAS